MVSLRGDPVYAVAKAYGLRSFLLTPAALEELSYAKNLNDFVEILRPTHYGVFLSQLHKPYSSAEVEKALWKGLVEHHFKLIETTHRPEFLRQLFMRHVHFNIKSVLKAKAMGKSADEILKHIDLFPETLLGVRDKTLKALNAKDLTEFLGEYLETPLSETLKTAVDVWNEKRDFSAVDAVIDKQYLENLFKVFRKTPRNERKFLQPFMFFELDVKAVATALRARFWGLIPSQAKNFLPSKTVSIDVDLLSSIVEAEELGKALEHLPENEIFDKIKGERSITNILSALEELTKNQKIRWAYKSFYRTPFRQTVLVAYLVLKETETKNLATIAKYIEEGVTDISMIRSSLSVP
ncbi:MAG: V-type ATPase subunit [Candidatus Caldarchaeum sp.]|nr:V-type ATPase subunit [Candidatus Caldarchaeum sp.]